MAHINSLVYLDQDRWLPVSHAQPAPGSGYPFEIAYTPDLHEAMYFVREQPAEQIVSYQGVFPNNIGYCPVCKALYDRSSNGRFTYQDLPPAVIYTRDEFTAVCCERPLQFISNGRASPEIVAYPSMVNGPGTTNSITLVQSIVNAPSYVILNKNQGKHRRASRESCRDTPKAIRSGRRRRSRAQHLPNDSRKAGNKTVEQKDIKTPGSPGNRSPRPSRAHSPIPFSRASTLAESPAPVQSPTSKVINLPPQAPLDSPKLHAQEPHGCMHDRREKQGSTRQGGLECGRAESILSSSTDSTKLGIIPPHKLAIPRKPLNTAENKPRFIGRSSARKTGQRGWLRFWRC
ncbi:hypothetical protein MaudCBS49596_000709 [Microsporum audouinii]